MGLFDAFKEKDTTPAPVTDDIVNIGDGTVVDITEVSDPVFAGEMLGKGVGVQLNNGKVCSPVSGKVTVAFPTGHAYGIQTENGIEVLLHIGIDTVNLNGEGFKSKVKQGDTVRTGDVLVNVDLDLVKEKGYDSTVMVIITNTPDFKDVVKTTGSLAKGDVILHVER